jgi:hypothetical protein
MPGSPDGIVSDQFLLPDSSIIFIIKSKNWGTQAENENTYSLLKADKVGNGQWAKKFRNANYNIGIKKAILLKDASILLTGTLVHKTITTDYSEKLLLTKFDLNGNNV